MSVSISIMSCICHLFPIEKVVQHSTARKTDISPEQDKSMEENKGKYINTIIHPLTKDKIDIYKASE